MRHLVMALGLALIAPFAQAQDLAGSPVPDRHVAISRDVDFPGGDLASLFDTNLDACQAACEANAACVAFTFNQRSGSCFPKGAVGTVTPYQGAISGRMILTPAPVLAQSTARAAELSFLGDATLVAARDLASQIGRFHSSDEFPVADLLSAATERRNAGDQLAAFRFIGAAIALTDRADLWLEYGRLGQTLTSTDSATISQARSRVLAALTNAYLRTPDAELRATILFDLATALEAADRGRDMIPALRLAQDLSPRRDAEAALERAIGLYGFRVADTQVDSDAATPRICVNFNEDLVQAGIDYAPFVQLLDATFTVDVTGPQLCIDGVQHGERYRVVLRAGLPAASGETLVRPVELTLYVRDRSPAVRFTSRAYVLPRTGDIALPVETVNLTDIDLRVFRVSDRNILRTMQEGLFAQPLYDWQQYWFEDSIGEPLWNGTAEVGQDLNRDILTRLPLTDALQGQPAGVYVLTAAVPGADPYDTPPATQWFILSDLGLSTMLGNDGLTVVVRALSDATPKAGTEVTLLSRANAILGTTVTDADGLARFEAGLTRGTGASQPALVTVTDASGDMAFLSLTDPAFDLSDRGVEGREPALPIDVFLATDRGAYRAGEVIHMTALMRDTAARAVPGLPLTAILTRPDGVEYSRIASLQDVAGGHVFALPVAGSAPRGAWTITVHTDVDAPPLATTQVLVEDFLPERIDFTLETTGPLTLADGGTLSLEARYLFGPPAADLPIEGEVYFTDTASLDAFPGYRFGLYDLPFGTRVETISGQTDADGAALIPLSMPFIEGGVSQPLTATMNVRVSEGSGRPVERRLSVPVAPDLPMIGIRPAFADNVVAENARAAFDLIALAPDRTPIPMEVTWTINRVETTYQWYTLYGSWNWEPTTIRTRVATGTATLGATPVTVDAPTTWGRYEIIVERTDGPYIAASTDFYAGWYVPADASATPDLLEVSLDAESYAIGDTATLRLVPRAAGTAVITVMSDRVIALQTIAVTEGENQITLPVTDDWAPGAYVTASVLRPMDVDAGRNPARALGLAHAAIAPGDRALQVTLEAPIEATPRETLTIGIDVQGAIPGEAAYVTLAAVDVGILNLTGFESPDPSAHYFGQRRLGVELRDIYGNLIDGLNGAMGTVRTGGDAMANFGAQSPPPTEELVAYFQGPVTVGPDGKATVSFDLPAFNGTVRVMAVAWNDRGVGQASMDILVRDPVVVTASLPRFLSPGDQSRLLLEIVHATGPAGEMGLRVAADGLVLATQLLPAAFTLTEGGKQAFVLPIGALDPGLHEITVTVTTPDGRDLVKTLTLPVQVNDPEIARTSRLTLDPGQTFTFDDNVFAGLIPGTGSATLTVGSLARLDAPGLINTLDRYPYGCTEQVASAALPLLYFGDVIAAMGLADRDEVPLRISQAVTEVLQNQSANGAFGLWGPYSGDLWLDAYVTDFLSRARARGHAVPDTAFASAIDNLRNRVNYYPDFETGGDDLAYALMVLAREGQANIGDLRYYADERAGAFTAPLAAAQLGAALAAYGDQLRADAMFSRAQKLIEGAAPEPVQSYWRADFGTHRRDAAAVLALALEAGSTAVNATYLLSRLGTAGTHSTQEAAWSLMAANALIDDLRDTGITVDGAAPEGPLVWLRDASVDAALAPVAVANTGTTPTDITLTTFGVPSDPEPAGGTGFAITRAWYTLDGQPATLADVSVGTRLVTVLTVQPLGRQAGRLMVADPLPAGFEIDNPNLLRGGDIAALDWLDTVTAESAQFRQDRFLAAVNWDSDQLFRLAYITRAVSPGTFHHPAASVEDMYRPSIRARSDTGRVTIAD
jgi:uncharacterized protein YfaS (alpha-2-macroglobulin family)